MTVEELKAQAAERFARINDPETKDSDATGHAIQAVRETLEFRASGALPPGVKPAFDWTVILQILLPIILAWIDRRFPPKAVPAPVPVPVPINP